MARLTILCTVATVTLQSVVFTAHAMSWYDAVGALATDPVAQVDNMRDAAAKDGAKMRAVVNAVVSEYDKIGAGSIAQQCLDASRIVQIAESRTGWKEIVFLIAVIVSLAVALFITKVIASMFNIAVAKLLWIPIGLCVAGVVALFYALRRASKHKMAVAAGVALSALGVVSVVDPVRHAFFDVVAALLIWFTSIYVPFVLAIVGAVGILLVIMLVFNSLCPSVGSFIGTIVKNLVALAVIPFVGGIVFLLIMSVVAPRVDKYTGGGSSKGGVASTVAGVPFTSYPKDVRQTATEIARVAEASYDASLPDGTMASNTFLARAAKEVNLKSWDERSGMLETKAGLVAQVIKHKTGWFGSETAVVFRGTASLKDVKEDIEQYYGVGEQRQYKEAASLVRSVRETVGGPIVVLGHSLGAGQAQYALAMNAGGNNIRGIGFNAAGLSAERMADAELQEGGSSVVAAGLFAHIRMDNDPVSSMGTLLGNVVTVSPGAAKGLASHSISALVDAMEAASGLR